MKLVLQDVTRFGNCLYIVNLFLYPDEDNLISQMKSITIVELYLSYSIF